MPARVRGTLRAKLPSAVPPLLHPRFSFKTTRLGDLWPWGANPALLHPDLGSVRAEEVTFYLVFFFGHLPALKPVPAVSHGATAGLLHPAGCPVSQSCWLCPVTCQHTGTLGTHGGMSSLSGSWPAPALKPVPACHPFTASLTFFVWEMWLRLAA